MLDSCVGSLPLPTPTAGRVPQEFTSPVGEGHGLLQPVCKRARGTGRSTRVGGEGRKEWRGSEHPDVNSVQTDEGLV